MASAALRDELLCSICLNTYTDPVTLRCGHNFCRVCIYQALDTQDTSGAYYCPECREMFGDRPALRRNIALCNIVQRVLFPKPDKEWISTGIFCTYCLDSTVLAMKCCQCCEASMCDKHLNVHSKSPEHVLTDPSTSLDNKKCSVHKKILEYYCTEDAACICVTCRLAGEHRVHQVEMLDEASEKKKRKLRNVLQKLSKKREKTEERVQSLEECRKKAPEKASGEAERVTALFIDIRRRLEDLEKRVLSEISRQEEKTSRSLSDVIQKLEIKKDELSRKMRDIEELCNMTDPLTVLQDPDTGDLCDHEEGEGDETHDVGLNLVSDTIHTGLLDVVNEAKTSLALSKMKMSADQGNLEECVYCGRFSESNGPQSEYYAGAPGPSFSNNSTDQYFVATEPNVGYAPTVPALLKQGKIPNASRKHFKMLHK